VQNVAGVNIARALALGEDDCSIPYAANAIGAPLTTVHRAVRRFQETGQYTRRPGSGRKRATTRREDRFLNNNGVPLFLPVGTEFNRTKANNNKTKHQQNSKKEEKIKGDAQNVHHSFREIVVHAVVSLIWRA
jgi:hypothetical protein